MISAWSIYLFGQVKHAFASLINSNKANCGTSFFGVGGRGCMYMIKPYKNEWALFLESTVAMNKL